MRQKIILEVTEKKVKLRWWKNDRLRCWTGKNPGLQFNTTMPVGEFDAMYEPPLMAFEQTGHFECNFHDVKCTEFKPPQRRSRP